MAASVSDKFKKVKGFFSTTLSAQKNSGASTMSLSDATGVPTSTGLVFTVGRVDANGTSTPSTRAIYKGTLSGTTVSNLTLTEGTDQTHAAGTVVEMTWTETHINDLVDGVLEEHNQDGTHSDVTATSINVSGTLDVTGAVTLGGTQGRLGDIVTFSSDGTWTKDANLKFIVVHAKGGGGGGGGLGTSSGIGTAGGGGEGATVVKKVDAASLAATEAVTVGDGGAGGVGNNTGTTGESSSLGSLVVAAGGVGGAGNAGNVKMSAGGAGGSTGTADLVIAGDRGQAGADNTATFISGAGGGAGGGAPLAGAGNGAAGVANSGGGGSGALDTGTSSRNGGAGGSGYVMVYEFY